MDAIEWLQSKVDEAVAEVAGFNPEDLTLSGEAVAAHITELIGIINLASFRFFNEKLKDVTPKDCMSFMKANPQATDGIAMTFLSGSPVAAANYLKGIHWLRGSDNPWVRDTYDARLSRDYVAHLNSGTAKYPLMNEIDLEDLRDMLKYVSHGVPVDCLVPALLESKRSDIILEVLRWNNRETKYQMSKESSVSLIAFLKEQDDGVFAELPDSWFLRTYKIGA